MGADLGDWERRLAEHFGILAGRRRNLVGTPPVFALEHSLSPSDVEALQAAIRGHIACGPPSDEHVLSWVVYAAEIGYGYSGEEYWQTFEQDTPGWKVHGDRYWIRSCYRRFERQYGGARPSGAWAAHFTLICWPITHAILPRDLQRQLARSLYELRHSFSAEMFESPSELGELIASRSWNASSRFQNLTQEPRLVGQIAAALLLQEPLGVGSLLHPAALERIVKDLDRERRAREWLRGAQLTAQERSKIRGLGLGRGEVPHGVRRPDEARAAIDELGIEPRVVLRPMDADASRWEVALELPDLSPLLFKFPSARDILTGARCVVAGASGRPLARGRCLYGAQRVRLARWPREDEVLLQFEEKNAQLEAILRTECLLRPGRLWLFRIASDGFAYEMRSLRVRPGGRYVVVATSGPLVADDQSQPAELECDGVRALRLDLPSALSESWQESLARLGLKNARAIEVWPAGLSILTWDGEGHGEWLAPERPCLAIRTDHPTQSLVVSIPGHNGTTLELASTVPGEAVFVQFPELPVGTHRVRIAAVDAGTGMSALNDALHVDMRIREARPWTPGTLPSGPLVVTVEPQPATLEQLWEGMVDIEVHGPCGRSISCVASLCNGPESSATVVEKLPALPLPFTPKQWKAHFQKFFQEAKKVQAAYDAAQFCRLEFSAGELGAFAIVCERDFVPLRWTLRHHGAEPIVRLIDDSGEGEPPGVSYYSFEKPTVPIEMNSSSEYVIANPGGLFVSQQKGSVASIIALPRLQSLADMGGTVQIEMPARRADAVTGAIEVGRLWESARSTGDILSWSKRRRVSLAIAGHISSLVGGARWAAAEAEFEKGLRGDLADLKRAVSNRPDERGIAVALALELERLAEAELSARVERLAEVALSFRVLTVESPEHDGPDNAVWLVEFALRLGSSPIAAATFAGPELHTAITRLMELPVLLRAARFLILAIDRQLGTTAATDELYASWKWT